MAMMILLANQRPIFVGTSLDEKNILPLNLFRQQILVVRFEFQVIKRYKKFSEGFESLELRSKTRRKKYTI